MYCRMFLKQQGATLIELVITITIVSIALVTLIAVTSQTTGRSADPMIQEQAVAVAEAYMEEILQKNFCDPDVAADCVAACTGASSCGNAACTVAEPPANRAVFDDVCDYNALPDNLVRDQSGTLVPGLSQYNITVQVIDNGVTFGLAGNQMVSNNGEVVRVDITVTHPAMANNIQLSGFRANF